MFCTLYLAVTLSAGQVNPAVYRPAAQTPQVQPVVLRTTGRGGCGRCGGNGLRVSRGSMRGCGGYSSMPCYRPTASYGGGCGSAYGAGCGSAYGAGCGSAYGAGCGAGCGSGYGSTVAPQGAPTAPPPAPNGGPASPSDQPQGDNAPPPPPA